MVVGRRETLTQFAVERHAPRVHFLRAYIAQEKVFVNGELEVNIQSLQGECRRIAQRLAPLLPEDLERPAQRGSMMLVITDKTFPATSS